MVKNFVKVAVRNILRNKVYSFINIAGLAVGLAGFILISIFIKNELSYDGFNKKVDRIYRVVEIQNQQGIGKLNVAVTMGPLAPALKDYFPEIESSVRMMPSGTVLCKVGDKSFYEKDLSYADGTVFHIFTIPFVEGDPQTALSAPFSLVITKSIARKYFGDENALGKTIKIYNSNGTNAFKVTGVIQDYPENSHIYFNMLASYISIENYLSWLKDWGDNGLATYILLRKGASEKEVEQGFPAFVKKTVPKDSWTDLQM